MCAHTYLIEIWDRYNYEKMTACHVCNARMCYEPDEGRISPPHGTENEVFYSFLVLSELKNAKINKTRVELSNTRKLNTNRKLIWIQTGSTGWLIKLATSKWQVWNATEVSFSVFTTQQLNQAEMDSKQTQVLKVHNKSYTGLKVFDKSIKK